MTTWEYPFNPYSKQQIALRSPADELLFGGSLGGGKDLALDTPVLTTEGWKTQGTLEVGDYVYGIDGAPTRVIQAHPVELNPCYRLTFSTGESIVAGEGHLWNVSTQKDRNNLRRKDPEWMAARRAKRASRAVENPSRGAHHQSVTAQRNRERAEAARALMEPANPWDYTQTLETKDVYALTQTEQYGLSIPRPDPITGGKEWPSELPPYVMGMWLGDGTRNSGGITQGDEDSTILIKLMADEGFYVYNTWTNTYFFRNRATGRTLDSMLTPIYGTPSSKSRIKHIPDWVFTTTYEDRLAVIQGLFDSDAHISPRGQVEFCLTDQRLFEDALRLLSTLGVRVSYTSGVAAYTKPDGTRVVTGTRYRTKFSTEVPVFRYPRKLERVDQEWVDTHHVTRRSTITIKSVEPCESVPTRCITVDHPRSLYLAGDTLIPTHNSELLLAACVDLCTLVPNSKALLVRRSFPELQELRKRLRDRIPPEVARENKSDNIFTFYNGAQLILRYLDNEDDATRLQGFELQLACFDELTHYDESSYALVLSRLRATGQVKADMDRYGFKLRALSASNPGGKGHSWVRERFIDPAPAGEPFTGEDGTVRHFIPSTLYDNPYIDADDYVRRLGALDPERKRALIEGDWGIPSGVRFPQFRERIHTIAPEELPIDVVGHARVVGVDFGFSDPFAAVWMAKVHGVIVVYREELSDELTATQQARRILELEAEGERRPERPITVALDPAAWRRDVHHVGPKLGGDEAPLGSIAYSYKQILGGRGGQVVKGLNDRLHGWATVDELLAVDEKTGLPRVLIYNNCRILIKALQSAPRDKRRPEDVDTHWKDDHILDSFRYGCLELLGRDYARKPSGHELLARARPDTVTGVVGSAGF